MKTVKDRLVSIENVLSKPKSESRFISRIEQIIKDRKASLNWAHWSASTDQWSSDRAYWGGNSSFGVSNRK